VFECPGRNSCPSTKRRSKDTCAPDVKDMLVGLELPLAETEALCQQEDRVSRETMQLLES
jgi:hypothetical protein